MELAHRLGLGIVCIAPLCEGLLLPEHVSRNHMHEVCGHIPA